MFITTPNITVLQSIIIVIFAMMSSNAEGQSIHYNVNLFLTDAPNTASYKAGDHFLAVLELDESHLTAKGDETLVVGTGLISIDFLFINNGRYTETDDPSNGFPRAFFRDGQLTGFDFWNSKGLVGGGPNSFFRFFKDGSYQYSPEGASEFHGSYSISATPVPEPSSTLLVLIASTIFLARRHSS